MKDSVDVVYVVASKLGSIGMGTAAYNAVKQLEGSGLSYKVFCRGYDKKLNLNKKNIISAGYLEYLSLPLRFMQKKLHLKINPFGYVNRRFGKFVLKKLPKCKIYHTWMDIAKEAAIKAKNSNAILILEGANSHPVNSVKILNKEYKLFNQKENIVDIKKVKKESEIYHSFDYIMCPSEFVQKSFLNEKFPLRKLISISYGVDTEKFKPKAEAEGQFRALFIGSIQLRKGIQYLLNAWDELKLENAELIVVGRVWPDAANVFEKYKKNHSIKFLGFNSDLRKYYLKSNVFVFPSLEEGSALVNYEAMSSGIPIIVTPNAGSVATDGKDGFIIPIRDTKKLKEKIKYFYDNPSQVKKMGKNARKKVEYYSWDRYGENLIKFYKKILKQFS